jgi:tripartite-type tricarboxylate transporter receptor subunit TctC
VGLVVDSDKRSPLFPNIPTIVEATRKTFAGRSYFGLLAPAKTPKPIVARLQAEVARIANEPGFRNRNFVERGLEPVASTPEEFARFIKEDRVASEQIVKESGLQPQ